MNPWICASLIATFGGLGGVVNALLSDNGFAHPRRNCRKSELRTSPTAPPGKSYAMSRKRA